MSRPPLPLGSWGSISTSVERTDGKGKPVAFRAKAKFRDHDGHVRPESAFGKTKTAAERTLLKKLQARANTSQAGELTAMHKISYLLDLWETRFDGVDRRREAFANLPRHLPPSPQESHPPGPR